MFVRVVILFCSLTIIFAAPRRYRDLSDETNSNESLANETVPDINPPDLTEIKSKYELLGGGYQGDMIFPKNFNPSSESTTKGVAIFGPRLWPRNIIPYDISSINSTEDRNLILQAMSTLMYAVGTPISGKAARKTCVLFRPKQKGDKKSFKIVYGTGCSATVGYWSYMRSTMTLANPGCFYMGTIQHELMHILGFYHEQSRPDRDSYITVNFANIQPGSAFNFDKFVWGRSVLNQQTPYDVQSIMHYGANYFSANGKPTITLKQSSVVIGQREQLSATDIEEIRALYSC